MVSAANSGKHEGRQRWPKQRQQKGRQQSTKSGSNSSGIGAGGGRDSGSYGCGSGNGDEGNCDDNVAAMAAVMAAPAWRRQWQRGRLMWAEVIFHITYLDLHDSTYRCDNNCQAYDKTQSVLIQNTNVF